MKKYIFTILAILLLVIGCDTQTIVTKGEISVNINGRSIDPISMETEYYKVSVSSGENLQSIPRVEKDTGTVRFSVDSGNWKVCVEAYNNHGDLIGRGEEEVFVSSGSVANCPVKVEEISGTGTFSFYYSYAYEDPNSNPWNRVFKATLSPIDNSDPTVVIEGEVSDFFEEYNCVSVNNGYYVFELYEQAESFELIYSEEVRVVANQISTLTGELYVKVTPGSSKFTKKQSETVVTEMGKVRISIDNTTLPLDSQIQAEVVSDEIDFSEYSVKWYINDDHIGSSKKLVKNLDLMRLKAGDKLKLSVIVTTNSNGEENKYYEDYCYLTIIDAVGFPKVLHIEKESDNDSSGLVYSYNDKNFSVVCRDYKNTTATYKGDWYINGESVAEDTEVLSLTDLTSYLGKNKIEFVYTIGEYSISTNVFFEVKPVIESITVKLDKPYAGRKNALELDINTIPENIINTDRLHVEFIDEKGNIIWNTEYLPNKGKYEVIFSDNEYFNRYSTKQYIDIYDAPENKELEVLPGTTLTRGAGVDIRIPYDLGENVEEIKWFLDDEVIVTNIFCGSGRPGSDDYIGPDFNNYTDKKESLAFGPLDWPAGKHDLKAEVKTKDNINCQVYVKEITVVEPLTSFNINFKENENGKISFQILPSSSKYTEYETTFSVNGSKYKTIGDEWKELEGGSSEYFNYSYHVTYKDNNITYHYDDYGDYSAYSKNDYPYLSLDKYIYKPSDYIVFDLHAPACMEGYIFKLDEEEIDIDYDGDGEYLLPRVERLGSHTLSIWSTNIEEPILSRRFVVSETGFISETPIEVYQRLVIALPNNSETGSSQYLGEGNGGSEETGKPGFGLEASYESLIIYENSYALYGYDASQGPIIDGGSIKKTNSGYELTSSINKEQVTLTKNNDSDLVNEDKNIIYKKINNPDCTDKGYLGSWKFAEIRPDNAVLNALLSFVPNKDMPFDSLVEFGEGEGVGLNLQFEIEEDWISAYIDLDLDATALDGQISLAPGFKLHLSGKAEYDVYDNRCLSIIGNGLPIYIQPSGDGSVLLIHLLVHVEEDNFMSIAVPLTRTEGVNNPVEGNGEYLSSSKYITLDSLYSFVKETADLVKMDVPVNGETMEIPGSALISSMFAAEPVEIAKVGEGEQKQSFFIKPGKWSVSDVTMDDVKKIVQEIAPAGGVPSDEAIEKKYGSMFLRESDNETDNKDINKAYNDFRNIFGSTLYVMMNHLEFLDDSSWLYCSRYEEDTNKGLIVFKALERIGGSQIVFTPMKQQEDGTIFVQVEYHKHSHPVKKGFLKLKLEKQSTDITFLYDYFSSDTELGLKVDSKDVYIEFGNDGGIWYKVGEQSYKVASYVLKNKENSIIIKTDSSTILSLVPSIEKPEGVSLDVGIVLPFDSSSNKIVFFEGKESQKTGIKLVDLKNQV